MFQKQLLRSCPPFPPLTTTPPVFSSGFFITNPINKKTAEIKQTNQGLCTTGCPPATPRNGGAGRTAPLPQSRGEKSPQAFRTPSPERSEGEGDTAFGRAHAPEPERSEGEASKYVPTNKITKLLERKARL